MFTSLAGDRQGFSQHSFYVIGLREPMVFSLKQPATLAKPVATSALARFLNLDDVPGLVALEAEKWTTAQAATGNELARRIGCHPDLSVGALCPSSGKLIASLFMKPVLPNFWQYSHSWSACAGSATPLDTGSLFGISLSSNRPEGVAAILEFFWPLALTASWRHIYLGSPIPGWRNWHSRHPGSSVVDYVSSRGPGGLPIDPQLRYYFAHSFNEVICVKRDYFPHAKSEDIGVILRGTVPLSS
jgi:hypothetical protein